MSDYYASKYPESVDAETWLLGGILQDPKSLGEISLIINSGTGAEFYLEKNQAVWNAMVTLYKADDPIDVLTVAGILEKEGKLAQVGGKDYIFSLMESVPSAANAEYYANMILDKFILRSLISTSNETIKESLTPTATGKDVLEFAEKRIYDLATGQVKEKAIPFGEVIPKIFNKILLKRQDELSGCPTDFYELDKLTNGLQKTEFIILAARPSMGKTALALNIASNAARQGKTVLFFSLEMDAELLVTRVLSSIAEIDQTDLRNGKMSQETFKLLQVKANEIKHMPLYIDDVPGLNAFDLLSKCRVFKRKNNNNLDLVVVDYLQLMKIRGDSQSREQGVADNSRMLKELAKTLEIPVLALSQLNRNVENRSTGGRPQLSDLRDSGSLEQDADMVWFIHRPSKEKAKQKSNDGFGELSEEEKRQAFLIIAKNRNGPVKDIELEFHDKITKFNNNARTYAPYTGDGGFSGAYQ
jgi:replicative DNA helicase